MNLSFLVLIKGMREEGESKIPLCYSRGSGASRQPSFPFTSEVVLSSACGVFVDV